jgi:hypothetical protein
MKKFVFALLAAATALAITPTVLKADTITISFTPEGTGKKQTPTVVTTATTGMITFDTKANLEILVSTDTDGNPPVFLNVVGADVTITGDYNNGAFVGPETVSVASTSCGGNCLTGSLNTGDYESTAGGTGDFAGKFTVDSVSAILDADFGTSGFIADSGVDSFNTTGNKNKIVKGITLAPDTSILTGGVISYDTPTLTPEPSSLILLGTGLFGLAFVAFRKSKSSGLVSHS